MANNVVYSQLPPPLPCSNNPVCLDLFLLRHQPLHHLPLLIISGPRRTTRLVEKLTEMQIKKSLKWTPAMEAALFDTLLQQQSKGKRADSGWKAEAWIAVRSAIVITYHGECSVEQCNSKYEAVSPFIHSIFY